MTFLTVNRLRRSSNESEEGKSEERRGEKRREERRETTQPLSSQWSKRLKSLAEYRTTRRERGKSEREKRKKRSQLHSNLGGSAQPLLQGIWTWKDHSRLGHSLRCRASLSLAPLSLFSSQSLTLKTIVLGADAVPAQSSLETSKHNPAASFLSLSRFRSGHVLLLICTRTDASHMHHHSFYHSKIHTYEYIHMCERELRGGQGAEREHEKERESERDTESLTRGKCTYNNSGQCGRCDRANHHTEERKKTNEWCSFEV